MANCCPHDWVDYVGAFGPTLATVFAGYAALSVYRRGESFQKQLVRPLLTFRHDIHPGHEETRWIFSLRNDGQGTANIESFTVLADNQILEAEPLEMPKAYWERVVSALGLSFRYVEGWRLDVPVSFGHGTQQPLFDAALRGQPGEISAGIKKLEVRLHAYSSLGEHFIIHHRYGHTNSAHQDIA
jgi:hypothetical protein